jgi:MFS family permease
MAEQSRFSLALRALHNRNFRLFVAGQLISLIGTWMQTVAESWLVYRLTGSSLLLGSVGFCAQFPVFLVAPLGGIVADRKNRHHILVMTQSASMVLALIYAALTISGRINVTEIFILAALLGVVNAFDIPTRQAFLVDMVGREDLMNAIALNSSMFNGARVVGPAVAGVLVAAIGEGWCFFANGVSYIAVITGLLLMHVQCRQRGTAQSSPLDDVREGFRYVFQTMPIVSLMVLLGVISLVGMPYAVLMPVFADKILHGGARGLGILMTFSGVGALCGALALAMRAGLKGLGRVVALASGGFGVALVLFSVSRNFWLSAVILVAVGFSMMTQMASSNTLIQAMVPDQLRGRVMAVYSMMFMGGAPFGALLGGMIADHLSAPLAVGIGGGISIVAAIVFGTRLSAIRAEARQLILAQQMTGGAPAQAQQLSAEHDTGDLPLTDEISAQQA